MHSYTGWVHSSVFSRRGTQVKKEGVREVAGMRIEEQGRGV
jgi:hypothetical protein